MCSANPLWSAPRIHGELLKVGIEVSQATVAKYMGRRIGTPSPTWRTFLRNQASGIAAIDMFVVPSAIFRILFVMNSGARPQEDRALRCHPASHRRVALAKGNRRVPMEGHGSSILLRDRDTSYGSVFRKRVEVMGITEVITAPRSPWQNAYVERVIGSIRRECLDYVVIFNRRHLRRVLASYVDYYHRTRTHLSPDKDCPGSRPVQPPTRGKVIAIPQVDGLHHRYERLAA
jgi:hypothetical protein